MTAFAGWVTSLGDSLSQFLSTAPLWIQAPLVMAVVIPLCAVLAVIWLRIIDFFGALVSRNRRPKTTNGPKIHHASKDHPRQRVITGEFD